ncbi:CMRF35-like molecule 3 [Trichomycterus rosablanca]|uniref:CMRF35-like molecule 3 n=1 Tax=Trichomycterus rosablanca TaxID=2290929 RepID=UPI002F34FB6D
MKSLLVFTFCLISAGTAADIITVNGSTGGSVRIRCPYEAGYEYSTKYLCRGKCSVIKDIPVDSVFAKDRRFSLKDNTTARVFTVTITDLRPGDKGMYWCAVQRTISDAYTEVQLQVRTVHRGITSPPRTPFTTSPSVSTSAPAESSPGTPAHTGNKTNQTSAASSTGGKTTLTDLKAGSEGSTVIITAVGVILVLLLIGLLIFIVILQRKRKQGMSQNPKPKPSLPGSSNNNPGAPDVVDYEEVNNAFYSSVNPPASTSDSTMCLYDNVGLPTSPTLNGLYTVAQKPSDDPGQDFYSTAQLPTGPTESPESSSLTYTQISFPDADAAAPRVIFKKEDACVYDNVNIATG